eukprot:372719_1
MYGDYSITGFIGVCRSVYEHLICSVVVWESALFYFVLLLISKYFFKHFYYPSMISDHDKDTLPPNLCIDKRSMTAASKAISFIAASTCCIRCFFLLSDPNWSDGKLWVSMYIPSPQYVKDLLDWFVGYFVVDTIYLALY